MTSYFKFLEWWLLPCDPYKENSLPVTDAVAAMANALTDNIRARYPKCCSGKYPYLWMNNRWEAIQWL